MGSLRHPGQGDETGQEAPLFPKLDDFESIGDQRRGGKQAVSVNGKMGRLVIYRHAYKIFETRSGRAPMETRATPPAPLVPAYFLDTRLRSEGQKRRQIHTTGDTKVISAKKLISEIGKTGMDTEQYYADWDPQNGALYVDLGDQDKGHLPGPSGPISREPMAVMVRQQPDIRSVMVYFGRRAKRLRKRIDRHITG